MGYLVKMENLESHAYPAGQWTASQKEKKEEPRVDVPKYSRKLVTCRRLEDIW